MQAAPTELSDLRLHTRSNVFLMAVLDAAGARPVRVRNLSPGGALLEGVNLPAAGLRATLKRGSLSASGEIAWAHDRHCGVRFDHDVAVDDWIARVGPEHQQRIDAVIDHYRTGQPQRAKLALVEGPALKTTLETLGAELMQIAERIAGFDNLSLELGEELVKIEAAALRVRACARAAR